MKYFKVTTYIDKHGDITCVKTQEEVLRYNCLPVRIVSLKEYEDGVVVTKLETTSETLMEV